MEVIQVEKKNEVWLTVVCEPALKYELSEYFKFQVPNYKFTPSYKIGRWDGFISLFSPMRGILHIGLTSSLISFCKSRGYELEIVKNAHGSPIDVDTVKFDEMQGFVDSLDIHSRGEKLTINDYQYHAIYEAIKFYRRIILSPTGSGKSLIIYSIIRRELDSGGKILVICPTTSLVEQMVSDFDDYASNVVWDAREHTHKIYSGHSKDTHKPIVVSTWQSLANLPQDWFSEFTCVITDEVHLAKAKVLGSILENCVNAKRRYGLTGSLDKSVTHKNMIQALFGPVVRVASTRDLIDKGHLSNIAIKSILLTYNSDTRSMLKGADYKSEIAFLIQHEKRNKFIRNLALSLKGNTLVLYTYVEKHGDVLDELLKAKIEDGRKYFYLHGGVDAMERDEVRHIVEKEDNAIILASFGVFSTGVNLKQLHNIIFASPTKSVVRVLQSVGRGLRKADGKTIMSLYDIGDRLSKKENHTFKHFVERLNIYTKEEFDYKLIELEIEK
jgi:superfamily II DNA or RNA helicase